MTLHWLLSFFIFLLLLNFCRLWLWQLNDTTTYSFKYNQLSGLVRSPQQKLSSGSEAIPGRLLPDLVHHGVERLGRHLVAAIWYQCSHLWLVRYFGVLNFWGFVLIWGVIIKILSYWEFLTIWVFSTICVVTIWVCQNLSFVKFEFLSQFEL